MRNTISKDQTQELKQVLAKMRVEESTIDTLLSSWNSANTYKAYRQGKKIVTDDNWTIHFGAKWATPPQQDHDVPDDAFDDTDSGDQTTRVQTSPEEIDQLITKMPVKKPEPVREPEPEDIASRTFKSIVSLIKKPNEKAVAPPPAPVKTSTMKRVIIEIDGAMLAELKQLAESEMIPVSALIRLAIRKYLN